MTLAEELELEEDVEELVFQLLLVSVWEILETLAVKVLPV